jgi:MarR family transcriptional regulator, lower aerobic nicotinate degradation pathway regulator
VSVNPSEESSRTPRGGRPRRASKRHIRMPMAPDRTLRYPSALLRQPTAQMFLLMREAFRLRQLGTAGDAAIGTGSLRFPHLAILASLEEFGPSSQRDVSARLRFDPSDLVTFVDALERQGLVVRARDADDRRRYSLTLTPAGRRALRRRMRETTAFNEEFFAPLSTAERDQLGRLLLRTLAHHDPGVEI